jgi:hypothetical protein
MMHSPPTVGEDAQFPRYTSFYRNVPLLKTLLEICESLLTRRRPVRVHVFAESTGEETWSLLFELVRHRIDIDNDVCVQASDLDASCVSIARAGTYTSSAVSRIPPDIRDRFLSHNGETFSVRHLLRRRVEHCCMDVRLSAGPPGSVDLSLFQNVLVHMPEADQIKAVLNLRSAQAPGGFLSLGGVPMGSLTPVLEELGYHPFESHVHEIHDAWESQRQAWLSKKMPYWALPPFQPERALDFCTIYRLEVN